MNKCDIHRYFGTKLTTRDIIVFQELLVGELYLRKWHFKILEQYISHAQIWRKVIKGFVAENGYFHSYSVFLYKVCIVYQVLAAKCRLDLSSSSTGSKVRKQVINSSYDHIWKTNAQIVNFGDRTIFSIIGYSNSIIYILNPSRNNL